MRQLLPSVAVAQEAIVADALEPAGEDVKQEATDELLGAEGHHLRVVVVAIVLPTEADPAILHLEQAMIGDGDTVGVASEVSQHGFRSSEGRLGVDDPFGLVGRSQVAPEDVPVSERLEGREELQLAGIKGFLQILQKQATKKASQHSNRQEESGTARDPSISIGRESATGDHAMEVGMMEQVLAPAVKYGEESDLGAEMFGIGGDGAQGLRRGSEENAVDYFLVLVSDGGNRFRHGEDDVEVLSVEDLRLAVLEPVGTGQ